MCLGTGWPLNFPLWTCECTRGEKVAPDPGLIFLGLSLSFLLPDHHAGLASVFTQMFQIFRSPLSSLPA